LCYSDWVTYIPRVIITVTALSRCTVTVRDCVIQTELRTFHVWSSRSQRCLVVCERYVRWHRLHKSSRLASRLFTSISVCRRLQWYNSVHWRDACEQLQTWDWVSVAHSIACLNHDVVYITAEHVCKSEITKVSLKWTTHTQSIVTDLVYWW